MIAGVLLAAGESSRMGGASKLLLPFQGKPIVRWAAEALAASGVEPLVAVLGREASGVEEALAGLGFVFAENPRFREGMATSISAGVATLPRSCEAVALALGDMPLVRTESIRNLLAAFASAGKGLVVPVHGGRRGHPVLFDLEKYRDELLALAGDEGGRSILARHPEDVFEVAVGAPGVLLDVDTAEEYADLVDLTPS